MFGPRGVSSPAAGRASITELASINLKREAFEKWRTGIFLPPTAVILFVTDLRPGTSIYVKALNKVKAR